MRITRRKKLLGAVAILIIALAVVGGAFFFSRTPTVHASIGSLQVFKGSAEVIRSAQTTAGSTGTPVELGDRIKVADGSTVALVLKDNTIIRLEGGSEAEVAQLSYQGGKLKDAVLKLTKGRAWSRVQTLEKDSNFAVETPTVTAAVRGTSFNVTSTDDISGVYVYHHTVLVNLHQTGGKQSVTQAQILQMKQSSLVQDFIKGPVLAPQTYFDEWIKFNQDQDDELCQRLHDIPDCGSARVSATPQVIAPAPAPTTNPVAPIVKPKIPKIVTPPPPVDTVSQVAVSCTRVETPNSNPNYYYHCTATATYTPSGKTGDVTSSAAWSLSDPQTGYMSGSDYYPQYPSNTIYANYGGKTGSYGPTDDSELG